MFVFAEIRKVDDWSAGMRNTFTSIYGYEGLQSLVDGFFNGMAEIKDKRNGDICKEMVKNIVAPTLILHGEKDPLVPSKHYKYLHTNIPGSK